MVEGPCGVMVKNLVTLFLWMIVTSQILIKIIFLFDHHHNHIFGYLFLDGQNHIFL